MEFQQSGSTGKQRYGPGKTVYKRMFKDKALNHGTHAVMFP